MPSPIRTKFEKVTLAYEHRTPAKDRPDASKPGQVYDLLLKDWDKRQIDLIEEVKLLLLDRSGKLMSIYQLSKGGMDMDNHTLDPKEIFTAALTRKAHQIIIAQNYPGGEFKPSFLETTAIDQIKSAGHVLDLPLIDYMVVTPAGYYSLKTGEQIDTPQEHPAPK